MEATDLEKKELAEKIFAKRQQVEFERNNIEFSIASSPENRQNPDVSEEYKNFNDPAVDAVEQGELKELSEAEKELIYLIDKLNKLNKEV